MRENTHALAHSSAHKLTHTHTHTHARARAHTEVYSDCAILDGTGPLKTALHVCIVAIKSVTIWIIAIKTAAIFREGADEVVGHGHVRRGNADADRVVAVRLD